MAINKEADFIMKDGRAIYPPVISDDSLRLWYDTKGKKNSDRYKDKMFDMSGNKNHGTLENFDYKNLSGYQEDSELVFDGIEDKLVLGDIEKPEVISATKNLFDGLVEKGYYHPNSGTNIVSENHARSKSFLFVKENTQYTLTKDTSRNGYIFYYNSDKELISAKQITGLLVWNFATPANCMYIKFHVDDTNLSANYSVFQLEEGTTATPYVPYIPSIRGTYQMNNNIISYDGGTVRWIKDGEVMERKGINLVRNQESQWVGINSSVVFNSGRIVSEGDGSLLYPQVRQELELTEGNKYLSIVEARVLNSECSLLRLTQRTFSAEVIKGVPNPTKNIWYELMGIQTAMDLSRGVAVYHRYDDEKTSVGKKMEIRNTQVIDLTATFGAGNEPTLEEIQAEPDKWQWFPNPMDLIETTDLKGNILGDMEDIIDDHTRDEQSGIEVFTDKADDGLVRVEIDGKSYQHLDPNARNMVPTNYGDWVDGHHYNMTDGTPQVYSNRMAVPWLIEVESNKSYYIDTGNPNIDYVIRTYDSNKTIENGSWGGSGSSGAKTTNSTTKYLGVALYTTVSGVVVRNEFQIGNIKPIIQDASVVDRSFIEYVPKAPTPDYPIEIHSLNVFDVVSSVGKRNLVKFSDWITRNNATAKGSNSFILENNQLGGSSDIRIEGRNLKLKPSSPYTLSFKIRKLDGNLLRIGGHVAPNFHANNSTVYIDGVLMVGSYNGVSFESLDNGEWYHVVAHINSLSSESLSDTGLLYIQPNRSNYMYSKVELTDVKFEEGHTKPLYSPALEDISESDNHPLIDKINLSLSEPLRSVGDVKDRLFRDSDGLWKIERNIYSETLNAETGLTTANETYDTDLTSNRWVTPKYRLSGLSTHSITSHFKLETSVWFSDRIGHVVNGGNQYHLNFPNKLLGILESDSASVRRDKIRNWLQIQYDEGTPVVIKGVLVEPIIETLDEDLQGKLNNLRSFQDSNYVYTVINDKTDILPTISENLKPTIHAEFLAKDWYKENLMINSLKIYDRPLEPHEMLENYYIEKKRFPMGTPYQTNPITQTINLTQGGYVANTLTLEYTIEI